MKKIVYFIILFLVVAISCGTSHESRIKEAVKRQLADYPASSLQDIYKSFFQDNFGPGHIVTDTAGARAYILYEIENARKYDAHYFEPAGLGDNFYRVSLATVADSIVPLDLYIAAFLASVKDIGPVDVDKWRYQWAGILEVIEDMNLSLPDYDSDVVSIDSLLSSGQYAWHHSRRYNSLYHPHYRLIKKEIFLETIKPLIDSSRVK